MKLTPKEISKITHEINSVWHVRYRGKKNCVIVTHSNKKDSPAYIYRFINYGFANYRFVGKYNTDEY